MLYQVKDWNEHFENNKSRERKDCSFVCVPNKQHGIGFSRIVAEPDGAVIYGIWIMILGACSQQRKPRDGWLTHDGHRAGTAWAPDDLSIKFRRPVSEIERTLIFLSSPKVGWLNAFDGESSVSPKSGARVVPACYPPDALEEKRREVKEQKEEKGSAPALEDVGGNEAVVPTVEEIATYCLVGSGIPPDYCQHYHTKKTVANGWIKNGQLIQWRIDIGHWWKSDRGTWFQRKSTATPGAPAPESVWSLQKQLDAVQVEIKKIQNRGHEDPVAGIVILQTDRQRYKDLKKQRDSLNERIAAGGQQ